MKEFGERLKRAREAAGLSLDDIHVKTRISRKNLNLLEAGDFPSIPQTYVRAFVREYARTVGLDEDETLALYNELAERERGIPRPPTAIDSSNLLPRIDDTVEFIPITDRSSPHVEVEGTAEVLENDFVPPVRKSRYVQDDDAAPIDIRTSQPKAAAAKDDAESATAPTPPAPKESGSGHTPLPVQRVVVQTPDSPAASTPPASETASKAAPAQTAQVAADKTQPTSKPASEAARPADTKESASAARAAKSAEAGSADGPRKAGAPDKEVSRAEDNARKDDGSRRPSVYDTKPPIEQQRGPGDTSAQDKRQIIIGLIILAMIVVGVYGIYFFSSSSDESASEVDSTAIRASIEAGRFIDSSQTMMTELDLLPEDTATAMRQPPEPVETKPRVYTRDDSLVLEAFSSSPVWFSVKMDTLRTERGSLSSNEHRVWKARDYFVVTLGDAGAVTFFLNGKEIGTLGEEGSVIKNVVLSRSHTRND